MAAESGKIDPMHQFAVETIWDPGFSIAGHPIVFTNSALWMCVAAVTLWAFMLMGMKRQVIPGRGQMIVENFVSFIDSPRRAKWQEVGVSCPPRLPDALATLSRPGDVALRQRGR